MGIGPKLLQHKLINLFQEAPEWKLGKNHKYIIISDTHMGNGKGQDDFLHNAELFYTVLNRYYLPRNFGLILNGDIEELQRFRVERILGRWEKVYDLFHRFDKQSFLARTVGNHDAAVLFPGHRSPIKPHRALKLNNGEHTLFIFHGHQASQYYETFNSTIGVILKYGAQPLKIPNFSVAHNNSRKYAIERRVYDFSNRQKVISIIGHTHRPLFESLSKTDYVKFKIEKLCREYPEADQPQKEQIRSEINLHKTELLSDGQENGNLDLRDSLYSSRLLVPSLFNSGCVIGKRGFTGIEIDSSQIRLVHWFDRKVSRKYFIPNGSRPEPLDETDIFRKELKSDDLEYIFTRIRLLA